LIRALSPNDNASLNLFTKIVELFEKINQPRLHKITHLWQLEEFCLKNNLATVESYDRQGREHLGKTIGAFVCRHLYAPEVSKNLKKGQLIEKVIQVSVNEKIRQIKAEEFEDKERFPRMKAYQVLAKGYRKLCYRNEVTEHGITSSKY